MEEFRGEISEFPLIRGLIPFMKFHQLLRPNQPQWPHFWIWSHWKLRFQYIDMGNIPVFGLQHLDIGMYSWFIEISAKYQWVAPPVHSPPLRTISPPMVRTFCCAALLAQCLSLSLFPDPSVSHWKTQTLSLLYSKCLSYKRHATELISGVLQFCFYMFSSSSFLSVRERWKGSLLWRTLDSHEQVTELRRWHPFLLQIFMGRGMHQGRQEGESTRWALAGDIKNLKCNVTQKRESGWKRYRRKVKENFKL